MSNLSDFLNKKLSDPILTLDGTEGTAGQVPISQGAGLPPMWGTTQSNLSVVEITTSQTWTPPFYPFNCIIDAIGGGSGGSAGHEDPTSYSGSGGCSGQVSNPTYIQLTEGQTLTIVIGAGGSGASVRASSGSSGGQTSVAITGFAPVVLAPGGTSSYGSAGGGSRSSNPSYDIPAPSGGNGGRFGMPGIQGLNSGGGPGSGIFSTAGAIHPIQGFRWPFVSPSPSNEVGGNGGTGSTTPGVNSSGGGGGGGGFGPGGNGASPTSAATAGSSGGGGGGGGMSGPTNWQGAAGGPGLVRIYY